MPVKNMEGLIAKGYMMKIKRVLCRFAILCCTVIAMSPSVQAIPLGEWEIISADKQVKFTICIQSSGSWQYSGYDDDKWTSKWYEHGDGTGPGYTKELILQGVHDVLPMMRSFIFYYENDASIEVDTTEQPGSFYELITPSLTGKSEQVSLKFKGAACAPQNNGGKTHQQPMTTKASVANNQPVTLGSWKVGPVRENGAFQFCAAEMKNTSGVTMAILARSASERWLLALPNPDGFQVGANLNVHYRFGIQNEFLPMRVERQDMLIGALPDGWIDGFATSGSGLSLLVDQFRQAQLRWDFSQTGAVVAAMHKCMEGSNK